MLQNIGKQLIVNTIILYVAHSYISNIGNNKIQIGTRMGKGL